MGALVDRTHKELSDEDIARIAETYHAWRGERARRYADVPGFCRRRHRADRRARLRAHAGRYVGAEDIEDDGESFDEKMKRLTAELARAVCGGAEAGGGDQGEFGVVGIWVDSDPPWDRRSLAEVAVTPAAGRAECVSGWRETTLGEFISLQRGHDLPEYDRRPGCVPVMGSFGVTGHHDEARASGPGVTVGRSGASFGVVSFCDRNYWPLNTCLYATDFHGNDPRFAYYLLKSIDFGRYNSGSAQPSLNRNFIRDIPIRVPPRRQRHIARTLGGLDDKMNSTSA